MDFDQRAEIKKQFEQENFQHHDVQTLVNPSRLHEVFSPVSTKSKPKSNDLRRNITISAVMRY